MASVFHLCCEAAQIKQNVITKYSELAESDKKLYFSAVAIQRTWRGYWVRKMIKNWHSKATTIQRFVRGWLVRLHLPERLKNYHYFLSTKYYNEKATKIQALWRGYCARKVGVSVKDILRQRHEIEMANKEMQNQMREAFEEMRASAWTETHQYVEKILMMLFERHHLLRTRTQEGVFSIHGSIELSCVERILRSFPLKDYMTQLHEANQKSTSQTLQGNKKTFDLNTTIKDKPYERLLLTRD
ncbi:hypothetical protein TcasGA2_TC032577 [Tribolium castaneum]|uniref:Uncharacterized protein n=1 Tax=Tribolium castaneum TaxID=7070 RepID=A0A139WK09_TRICA|nr:PREDICTED: uncharacterized protein LOC103312470 [Tribolium castaneum]KYB28378.1 hypothetical protein TcasGA2_TC032577 [Tribolium castaneum]|eukprot:XP_008191378.1 PREDICTED: uncharacterized protein LOC103312470 [Tribolium castaneum]